jgi:hypothetical protein
MNIIGRLVLAPALAGWAGTALAGEFVAVSEPGTLTLLGLAGVGVAVAIIRKRSK